VVSLGKLTSGHESYYEREVAGGAEDYYAMRGEAAGEWVGTGSASLGLEGQATGGELRELLEGRDPATGQMLRGRTVRVTGWDVTYSPPKSVSVLHAAGDPRVAAETLAGHRTAVRSALRYLESEACWTRRGAGGAVRLVGEGFVGVEYVHRVSRAGNAQLHSHVVIGNLTRADGRWTTLDGRALYANLKTASALYHAELRTQMTHRLGVEWEPVARGKLAAEIRGVPAVVLRDQSRRHREIIERMENRGESGPRAAQTAALDTRKAKDYTVDGRDVARELRARIAEKGLGSAEVAAVLDRRHLDRTSANDLRRMSRRLLSAKGITEHRSTFSRGDVIQRWATWHRQGEPADRTLEAEAGVRAVNTTRLLADIDRGNGLPPETVLLVDEAGMVGTRTYHRLAEHVTAAGGKLIGIGDSRQLAEIQAGGAFRAISDRFGAVALAGNRRQLDPEEIRALAALRDGDVHAYVLFEHQRGV
jgi:conjugative relaxase-like TrwC/TraI family protein